MPENYLASFTREQLIRQGATMKDEDGRPRPLVEKDIREILDNAARRRGLAHARVLPLTEPSQPAVGPFRYHGMNRTIRATSSTNTGVTCAVSPCSRHG